MIVTPPVLAGSASGDREAEAQAITVEFTRRLETLIRRYPAQYLWMHRRWRTPPQRKGSK